MRRSAMLLAGALLAVPSPAWASDGTDKAAATELFNAGRDMMKSGDYAAACPKLAESARLDPTVGALAKLAECEEHERRLVSAYGRWQQALNLARATGDERAADVQREVARMDAVVPKLRIGSDGPLPPDTVIRLDAVELGPASVGVPLAVEPGMHALQASAPHRIPWFTTVETKADGATTPVSIPSLADAPAAAPVAPPPATLAVPRSTSPSAPGPWPTAGLVTAGAGVLSGAVGAAFGVAAMTDRNRAGCPGNVCPSDASANTLRGAKSSADVATALFIAGGALLAGGVTVWWLSSGAAATKSGILVTPFGAAGAF